MNEEYRTIDGYEGLYEVSNLGNVRSLYDGRHQKYRTKILKPRMKPDGHVQVVLSKSGKVKQFLVHRLVAQAFLPNPQNLPQVNHKNEIADDNRVENLEWCTAEYNANYGTRNQRAGKSISKALRGKPSGRKGTHHSEETKRKISESLKRYFTTTK